MPVISSCAIGQIEGNGTAHDYGIGHIIELSDGGESYIFISIK